MKVDGSMSILDFQKTIQDDNKYYNYYNFLEQWERVFGRESIYPRIFDRDYLENHDLRIDFIRTMLPNIDIEKLNFDITSANESLSFQEAKIFQAINAARPRFVGKYYDPTPAAIKSSIRDAFKDKKVSRIADPRQESMYNQFYAENVKFFNHFFGIDKNIFRRPDHSSNMPMSELTFTIDDVAEIIALISSRDGLIQLSNSEIDLLRDLAIRLENEKKASREVSTKLLTIASRARPKGNYILEKINELRRK